MLDRVIINTLYLVPLQVNKFKKQYPNTEVLIADATKARKVATNEEVQYGIGWATARRGVLMLTTDGLFCGDWTILLSNIQEATLLHISGGLLLKVSTTDGLHYQFGLQQNPVWEEQKVLPLNVQQSVLKFSKTSFILQLLILAGLVYITSQDYLQNGLSPLGVLYFLIFMWFIHRLLMLLRFPPKK